MTKTAKTSTKAAAAAPAPVRNREIGREVVNLETALPSPQPTT